MAPSNEKPVQEKPLKLEPTAHGDVFKQVLDPASRANPYPLYAELRKEPVCKQEDGLFVVSGYAEIYQLLHDPRMSSADLPAPPLLRWTGHPFRDLFIRPIKSQIQQRHRPFIFRDPPDHDGLRRIVMSEFRPERVRAMRAKAEQLSDDLLDRHLDDASLDLVDDFAYPLPVTIICELLGVPRQDQPQFQAWSTQLATALDPDQRVDSANQRKTEEAFNEISRYIRGLVRQKRRRPTDDILSGLAKGASGETMGDHDLIATAVLLLVAGHETTVNLISNGVLTLLREPKQFKRLKTEPQIAPQLVEEVLRFDPPVQYRTRLAVTDIAIGGVTIPKGAPVVLLLAAGNRDASRFAEAEKFDPDRPDNRHFGFGGGLHYCVGAPLARIEAEVALTALARRLEAPRLVRDPPLYRDGASLRGPLHLPLVYERMAARTAN